MKLYQGISKASERLSGISNYTPVMTSRTLNKELNCNVFLKCENYQRMGAFKFRGAYNAISCLTKEDKERGVVTHSSGNHAQAVALAGKLLNVKTIIVMPENTPEAKRKATQDYGAKVVFSKSTQQAREKTCATLMRNHGYLLIHPYDNKHVVEGAGTACKELLEKCETLDAIITPVGGGGLLSGTSIYAKNSGKVKHVFGAEPSGADDAYRSFVSGKLVGQDSPNTIADGLRTSLSEFTFSIISKYVDKIVTVSERNIITSMRFLWERMKMIVEPSGAVSLAGLRELRKAGTLSDGSNVGLIISGGNLTVDHCFEIY